MNYQLVERIIMNYQLVERQVKFSPECFPIKSGNTGKGEIFLKIIDNFINI